MTVSGSPATGEPQNLTFSMCRLGFKAAVEYTKETEHVIEKHVCALSYGYSSHYYLCINYLSVTHACSETKSAPLSPLSQDSPW